MGSAVTSGQVYRFGLFEADVRRNTLTRSGVRVKIQDQPFRALITLLECPGEIVSREELRQKLWPEGTFVDFDGSLNVILKKLRAAINDDSENPRFIETVPRRGYRFIAPVSIQNLVSGVEPEVADAPRNVPPVSSVPVGAPIERPHRGIKSQYIYVAVLGILVVAAIVWFSLYRRHSLAKPYDLSLRANAQVPLRKSIAVLGFHNASGRASDTWLSTAFSEMLRTELAGGDKLRLVSGEEVASLHLSSPWAETDTLNQATTSRIGSALNSDLLVLGSYTVLGRADHGQLRLDVRLQDAKTGEILTETAETGGRQDTFELVSRVGIRLRDRLGLPPLAEPDQASGLASMPANRDAARLYALGLAKLRDFDALAARDLLQQACDAEPKFPLSHLMLSRAWSQLGYEQKRKDETKSAFELSANLPRTERMLVEGDYYDSLADHEKAASTYRALFELFPDSVDYGILLAASQSSAGHPDQAFATIAQLRRLPAAASNDPRIDLAEEATDWSVGKYQAAENAAERAAAKATSKGIDLLLAKSLSRESESLAHLGDTNKAISVAEQARSIYSSAGDRAGVAAALTGIGTAQWLRGEFESAGTTMQQALIVHTAIGNKTMAARDLRFVGNAAAMRGDSRSARNDFEKALAYYREVGDRGHIAYTLIEIAWIRRVSGDDPTATGKDYDEALSIFREMSNDEGVAEVLDEKGSMLASEAGQIAQAKEACQEALELYRKSGEKNPITRALFDLGNIAYLQDKSDESLQRLNEALAISREIGDAGQRITVELELGRMEFEEQHFAEAKKFLDDIFSYLHSHQNPNQEISADSLSAEIELSQGNIADAKAARDAARKLIRPNQWLEERYIFGIANARVEAANGNVSEARESLKSLISDTIKHHYLHYQLEGRLALCELEAKTNPSAARLISRSLQKDASDRGFNRIARKAGALVG